MEVSWGRYDSTEDLKERLHGAIDTQEKKLKLQKLRLQREDRLSKVRKDGKTKHVQDVLSKRSRPREVYITPCKQVQKTGTLKCLDAVGCRSNALLKCSRGLPVFSPIDPKKPFVRAEIGDVDFVFVEVDEELHSGLFPYTGARWYAAEVVEYMLERGTIRDRHCRASLTATRHVEAKTLQQHLNTIKQVYDKVHFASVSGHPPEFVRAQYLKRCFLSAIGLWNSTSNFQYSSCPSFFESDAGAGVVHRRRLPDGSFVWSSCTEIVSLYSMAPWGRIALDVEQMRVAQALETAEKFKDHVDVAGVLVDGVFIIQHTNEDIDSQLVAQHLWPDGTPQFQLKQDPPSSVRKPMTDLVPTWKQGKSERSQKLEFSTLDWITLIEDEHPSREVLLVRLVELILDKKGLMIEGLGGVGKSVLVKEFMKLLDGDAGRGGNDEQPVRKKLVAALRHCTCKPIGGRTIQHYLCKYREHPPASGTIVIIDEWSEVPLHVWAVLAHWKLFGVIFVLVGDADGQKKPSFDSWKDAMDQHDIRYSSLIHELCGGVKLRMEKYRRGKDQLLFDRMKALYPFADDKSLECKDATLNEWREWYKLESLEVIDAYYLVLSHADRVKMNTMVNWHLAAHQTQKRYLHCQGKIKGISNQPQHMIVWPGIELACVTRRSIVNGPVIGVVYVVDGWDATHLTVTQHEDFDADPLIARGPPQHQAAVEEAPDDSEDEADDVMSDHEEVEVLPESVKNKGHFQKIVKEVKRPDGKVVKRDSFRMTFKFASENMRLQYAIVHAQIQGRTFRKDVVVLDLDSMHVKMRDIITAVGRPTTGEHLHFPTWKQSVELIELSRQGGKYDLEKRAREAPQAI